jgi:predicted glycogen debranching enzyme
MNFAESASTAEWLETNALGGFAASTATGLNSRRYHALLTAALTPPGERMVLLSKVEETLIAAGERFQLSTNQYPGALHPTGFEFLDSFTPTPIPTWRFTAGGVTLTKRLFLVDGENTLVIEYSLDSPNAGVRLEVRPLVAFRGYHALTQENSGFRAQVDPAGPDVLCLQPYAGGPELFFGHNATAVIPTGHWYRNFEYSLERERGLDYREDLQQPFVLDFPLGSPATLVVSTSPQPAAGAALLFRRESQRRDALDTPVHRAADQFLVRRAEGWTVIAGYPWFTDWGRDTMIALPGLMAATKRYDAARGILATFAQFTSQGMLPNWFPEDDRPAEYNTMDASLWFFEAVAAYYEATGDRTFVERDLYPVLKSIVHWHLRGTRYGIHVDDDGLLTGGADGVQLTWMDAKLGDWVVTPRRGKAVEIQALWYNALRILEGLALDFYDPVTRLRSAEMADWALRHFEPLFWNYGTDCLFDCVDGGNRDAAIRPNQVLAASLRHPLLTGDRAARMIAVVERELLTPMGLRTLSPRDPRYRAVYEGTPAERDSAYHQGTVWPWLIGPFIDAYLRVHERSAGAVAQAAAWLEPLREHLEREGQICEIADAEAPHRPRGCPAQAWSVAEFARAWAAVHQECQRAAA